MFYNKSIQLWIPIVRRKKKSQTNTNVLFYGILYYNININVFLGGKTQFYIQISNTRLRELSHHYELCLSNKKVLYELGIKRLHRNPIDAFLLSVSRLTFPKSLSGIAMPLLRSPPNYMARIL